MDMSATLHTLISAPVLATKLADPSSGEDWLILDCRFSLADPQAGEQAYAQGHITGALYAHLDRDLSGAKTGTNGRHPLPSPDDFQATLRRWGLQPGTHAVAYDDARGMFAARLWWLLHWAGHEQVQVLDGGWKAWLAAHGAVESSPSESRAPSRFEMHPHADWVVSADEVLAALNDAQTQVLLDARAPDRFRGENETIDPVGGHIPGARNRWFQLNLRPDGHFKPADQLHAEFEGLLGDADVAAITNQCGSGVSACHNILAMAHAGWPMTRLYAGSWSEWCADPARPVAR